MALAQNEGCATTIVRSAHAEHGTLTYGRWWGRLCATDASSLHAAPSWTNASIRAMMPLGRP